MDVHCSWRESQSRCLHHEALLGHRLGRTLSHWRNLKAGSTAQFVARSPEGEFIAKIVASFIWAKGWSTSRVFLVIWTKGYSTNKSIIRSLFIPRRQNSKPHQFHPCHPTRIQSPDSNSVTSSWGASSPIPLLRCSNMIILQGSQAELQPQRSE